MPITSKQKNRNFLAKKRRERKREVRGDWVRVENFDECKRRLKEIIKELEAEDNDENT